MGLFKKHKTKYALTKIVNNPVYKLDSIYAAQQMDLTPIENKINELQKLLDNSIQTINNNFGEVNKLITQNTNLINENKNLLNENKVLINNNKNEIDKLKNKPEPPQSKPILTTYVKAGEHATPGLELCILSNNEYIYNYFLKSTYRNRYYINSNHFKTGDKYLVQMRISTFQKKGTNELFTFNNDFYFNEQILTVDKDGQLITPMVIRKDDLLIPCGIPQQPKTHDGQRYWFDINYLGVEIKYIPIEEI